MDKNHGNQKVHTNDLIELYGQGKSDYEISETLNVHRTTVSKIRKQLDLKTHDHGGRSTARESREIVKEALLSNGFRVIDKKAKNMYASYDFLVNGLVKIQVYGAAYHDQTRKWQFTMSPRKTGDISDTNKNFIKVNKKNVMKDLSVTCDVVVLCGISDFETRLYIIQSKLLTVDRRSISITYDNDRFNKFLNRWSTVELALKKRTG